MLLPPRADDVNYFLLGSPAIICIFHLAVLDAAGGREDGRRNTFHFVSQLSDEVEKIKRSAEAFMLDGFSHFCYN